MTFSLVPAHLLYALAWLAFGLTHSGLAGGWAKRRLRPWLGRWYRLTYNLIALAQFAALAVAGDWLLGREAVFPWPGWLFLLLLLVHLAGWVLLFWAARYYDLGRLMGFYQLKHPEGPEDEPLHLDGPHLLVRHPLYAAAFLILWGGAANPLGLATALWGSLYLLIGTWHEERHLLSLYGEDYASYRMRTPAFLPRLGRRSPSARSF